MASIDYARAADRAQALLERAGALVTFERLETAEPDPEKPWDGPENPRSPAAKSVSLPTVAVPPSSASQLGMRTVDEELLRRTSQILIVAPGAAETADLATFQEVVRDGKRSRINFVETLRPAAQTVLYFVGVKR